MSIAPLSADALLGETGVHAGPPPLCVDLDGTLILGDLLLESVLLLVKRNPLYLLLLPIWLLRGKAVLKAEVAARVSLDPGALPYDRDFIDWLQSERGAGRSVWLCTAANELLATRIAAHLEFFDGVFASDRHINLAGQAKAACLVEKFGTRGFDYCGNEWRDIAIWKHARGAVVVHGHRGLQQAVAQHTTVLNTFVRRGATWRALIKALRPHQWAKNSLVLVPMLAAHQVTDPEYLAAALLATVTFCLCASSAYVLNDLLDLQADRVHPRKSKRPFAAGDLSILTGLCLASGLLAAAISLALFLPPKFQFVLGTYYALTLLYSARLKRIVLVDAITLAGLYTLRVIAGGTAIGISLSFWLLSFSLFLFLSLAFLKRFVELDALRQRERLRPVGRDYHVHDLPVLQSLGSAAGYMSVIVLALYIHSQEIEALYRHPTVIWILCVLMLYWISRVWIKAQRGEVHDDPVVFALKDHASLALGLVAVITVFLAI